MDITAFMGNLQSLALLYGWALFAAAVFALGERVCRNLFGRQPAAVSGEEPARSGKD